jgi:hypothetical protein
MQGKLYGCEEDMFEMLSWLRNHIQLREVATRVLLDRGCRNKKDVALFIKGKPGGVGCLTNDELARLELELAAEELENTTMEGGS